MIFWCLEVSCCFQKTRVILICAELIFRLEALRAKHSQGSYYLSGYRTEDISSTIALLYTGGHQKLSLKPLVLEDLCMWTLPLKLFPSRHCFHELGSILLAPVFWDESLTQWVWYTWDTALLLINLINWGQRSLAFFKYSQEDEAHTTHYTLFFILVCLAFMTR